MVSRSSVPNFMLLTSSENVWPLVTLRALTTGTARSAARSLARSLGHWGAQFCRALGFSRTSNVATQRRMVEIADERVNFATLRMHGGARASARRAHTCGRVVSRSRRLSCAPPSADLSSGPARDRGARRRLRSIGCSIHCGHHQTPSP